MKRLTGGGSLRASAITGVLLALAHNLYADQASLGTPTPEGCVDLPAAEARVLAERHAPELYPAPTEDYLPTLPFFSLFDTLNNDGIRGSDFGDLTEVAPLVSVDSGAATLISWDTLDSWYSDLFWEDKRASVVVPFRACTLTEGSDELWRFLQKDDQAWDRFGMEDRWPADRRRSTVFNVVQYYFYYVNDVGVEGHPEDIEFVFVFVPQDELLAEELQIVVGAGHGDRIPNNVLVFLDFAPANRIFIELGGHATAPLNSDDPLPRFQRGRDVNWHVADVWGVRDLPAISGTGFFGDYRPEMTLERNRTDMIAPPTGGRDDVYSLVPVYMLRDLDQTLATGQFSASRSIVLALGESLGVPMDPALVTDSALTRLAYWTGDLWSEAQGVREAKRHKIWLHDHYVGRPTLIFAEHLFRPPSPRLDLMVWGTGFSTAATFQLHAGWLLPPTGLPFYIPGFFEARLGLSTAMTTGETAATLALHYERRYRDHMSWFGQVLYATNRKALQSYEPQGHVALAFGLSILAMRPADPPSSLVDALRIRVGPRFTPKGFSDLLRGVGLLLEFSFRQG